MNELYILRHAKAVASEDGGPDRERKLTDKGRKAARNLGEWIAAHALRPDLVLCSTAARTRETLELILSSFPNRPELLYEAELYLADATRLLARLREVPKSVGRVMMVGHNPGLQELAAALIDKADSPLAGKIALGLPTANLACFEIAGEWAALRRRGATLVDLVNPKE